MSADTDTHMTDLAEGEPLSNGLIYVSSKAPGLTRRKRGRGFSYHHITATASKSGHPKARRSASAADKARIAALAIPPAWTDVWICTDANGHLQATGLDDRDRKQYLYHPQWQTMRAMQKFGQLPMFGMALGRLRQTVLRDLETEPGEIRFSLAALVLLIDQAALRVGSTEATRENRTYGATTLLSRHMSLKDGSVCLRFLAKGGKRVQQTLRNARLHRILQDVDDLPGRNLFTYINDDGIARPLTSGQVNAYIAEAVGVDGASAKTFRTWAGSVAAYQVARRETGCLSVRAMAEAAAAQLYNTPAISRSSYIHPRIIALADAEPDDRIKLLHGVIPKGDKRLRVAEREMLGFLASRRPARVLKFD